MNETKVKITTDYPPKHIYDKCVEKFGVDFKKGTVFTYGTNIHCYFYKISDDLLEHELTHVKQQSKYGVEEWWERYFEDPEFRLMQELEAYHNQYVYLQKHTSRPYRKYVLKEIVKALSGDMYGNLISPEEAERVITKEYE